MGWIKLDDNIGDHPKLVALDPKQRWLWMVAIAHANRYGTDGHIAADLVLHLSADYRRPQDARRAAEALVAAGLWRRNGAGYDIHDYLDYQPSGAEVRQKRRAAAERQRRFRERYENGRFRQNDTSTVQGPQGETADSNAVSNAVTSPTRDSNNESLHSIPEGPNEPFNEPLIEPLIEGSMAPPAVQGPQGESADSNAVSNTTPTRPDPKKRFSPSVRHTISESQEGDDAVNRNGASSPAPPPQDTDPVFAELWERWPKQYGKRAAYRALGDQARTYAAAWSAGDVIAGIVNYADGYDGDARYCPALARFLEDELWREHQQPTPTRQDKIKAAIDAAFGPEEPEPE